MITPTDTPLVPPAGEHNTLQKLAIDLEANFLAEMLKTAGFGAARDSFGGGIGEEQFTSFLVKNHAQSLAQNGGIGLAEHIFQSLKGTENVDG